MVLDDEEEAESSKNCALRLEFVLMVVILWNEIGRMGIIGALVEYDESLCLACGVVNMIPILIVL
jgi:hypothetical protein